MNHELEAITARVERLQWVIGEAWAMLPEAVRASCPRVRDGAPDIVGGVRMVAGQAEALAEAAELLRQRHRLGRLEYEKRCDDWAERWNPPKA